MWDKPPIEEDAPVGSLLRQSSQKTAHEVIDTIRSLAEEGVWNKSSRQYGAHKRRTVGFPQLLEPNTLDPPYVPVPEPKSSRTDDSVTCLEGGEEVAPTTSDDIAYLQETDKAPPTLAKVNKMCKKFNLSIAMGSGARDVPRPKIPRREKTKNVYLK